MKIAVFDPFCGAAGNMVLGSLLDCGVDVADLEKMLSGLGLHGWELHISETSRGGLRGILVEVHVPNEAVPRNFQDILDLLSSSDLPEKVREESARSFGMLAEAESHVHGIPVEEVHFHETGAMDAIIDITGSFCGLYLLGVDRVYSSAVATGTGTVECSHGTLPVPAPATMRILRGIPTSPTGIPSEITTPTGAAILAAAVTSWDVRVPPFRPLATGYGSGTGDLQRPNLLRLTIGDTPALSKWENDSCVEIRTLIDDMDPRSWPDFSSKILRSGVLDCWASVCLGKKGRPAMELAVLCPAGEADGVIEKVFRNTTAIGMRVAKVERAVLDRCIRTVLTEFGPVRVKDVFLDGRLLRTEPEYDDCSSAAGESGASVLDVISAARWAARSSGKTE